MLFKVTPIEPIIHGNIIFHPGTKYNCYGWVTGGDERIYGICSDGKGHPFTLIEYNKLQPVGDKKLNG